MIRRGTDTTKEQYQNAIDLICREHQNEHMAIAVVTGVSWKAFQQEAAWIFKRISEAKNSDGLPRSGSSSCNEHETTASYSFMYRSSDEERIKELRRQADELEARVRKPA